MSIQALAMFIVAATALALAPGPDILTVITRSVAQGVWAGLVATLGFASGLIFHTSAAALGISLILSRSPSALRAIQLAGAVYLLYLALRMIVGKDPLLIEDRPQEQRNLVRIYGQSVLMNVLNPKVTLFFLTFLPQFVEPAGRVPIGLQMIILGSLFAMCTIACFGGCAMAAGKLTGFLRKRPRAARPLRYFTAAVFAAIAVRLALWW